MIAVAVASPAKAQTTDAVQESIDRVDAVASMLMGIITNFTNVLITPMGIGAAARIFRHVVLANV
ncbi:MAG: hypothetical protein F6K24_07455 [Okeania sp. SIO2D1]|nr:hypothetical protein [Okeania sp. SIO2D1]